MEFWSSCTNGTAKEEDALSYERELIDAEICVKAKDFLGIPNDFFTKYVFLKREIAGVPTESNFK